MSVTTHPQEPLWPARFAILLILALQLLLNPRLTAGPNWLLPALELTLLLPLSALRSAHQRRQRHGAPVFEGRPWLDLRSSRTLAILLILVLDMANTTSLVLLMRTLLHGTSRATGAGLLVDALDMWVTNVLVYSLWYWELDRGGPLRRRTALEGPADFLFPPMTRPDQPPAWRPTFTDYLFVSVTNSTAFSPTDTLPLSALVKWPMMAQALTSLLITLLVASRAVNILS